MVAQRVVGGATGASSEVELVPENPGPSCRSEIESSKQHSCCTTATCYHRCCCGIEGPGIKCSVRNSETVRRLSERSTTACIDDDCLHDDCLHDCQRLLHEVMKTALARELTRAPAAEAFHSLRRATFTLPLAQQVAPVCPRIAACLGTR